MRRDIRIWSGEEKRCEALWLSYLLTLCGHQVWKGRLEPKEETAYSETGWYDYVDIVLLDKKEQGSERLFFKGALLGTTWICGDLQDVDLFLGGLRLGGVSDELSMGQPQSMYALMDGLCEIITEDEKESESIQLLTDFFMQQENELSCCIYTISEMFCSRRIDYSKYEHVKVLHQAISSIEKWLKNYTYSLSGSMTYPEMFTVVYLQNLLNEGYVKARKYGGYDVNLLLQNTDYMLKYEEDSEAVLFLKLQILHNSVYFQDSIDDILKEIAERVKPEYVSGAFCEAADIIREDKSQDFATEAVDYYEKLNINDIESYRGLYRAGLAYEGKAGIFYKKASDKYRMVRKLLNEVSEEYRTPQEFEYFYKAEFGEINVAVELDKENGRLTAGKRTEYQQKLKSLEQKCSNFKNIKFFEKMYQKEEVYQTILGLMGEKMGKVQNWAKTLDQKLSV